MGGGKMKEIGGYFGCEESLGREYHENTVRLNSGRNCLRFLLREKKIKEIAIPYYICDAVIKVCEEENCKIVFYHIDKKFQPIINEGSLNQEIYIYIVNYFGQLSNAAIIRFKMLYRNLIVDNSQAFFQRPVEGVDTLYTCRKFFGVPDGGYLFPPRNVNGLERDISYNRCIHLLGRFEVSASEFYDYYSNNEKRINDLPLLEMSLLTRNMLKSIDYKHDIKVRTQNFSYLNKALTEYNELDIKNIKGGFMYPLLIKDGEKLRNHLIANRIYIPAFWNNVLFGEAGNWEKQLARSLVCVPCDQRYTIEEMKYITDVINEWRKEGTE